MKILHPVHLCKANNTYTTLPYTEICNQTNAMQPTLISIVLSAIEHIRFKMNNSGVTCLSLAICMLVFVI